MAVFATATPRPASQRDKARILALLQEGQAAGIDMQSRRGNATNLGQSNPEAAYEELLRAERAEALMSARFSDAIMLAETAFNVGPTHRRGVVAGGPAAGVRANWAPRYMPPPLGGVSEASRVARFVSPALGVTTEIPEAFSYGRPGQDNARAATFVDGAVVVTGNLIQKAIDESNPGYIAAALHHEAVHFDELVTTGWRSALSREACAYESDARYVGVFGLPLSEGRRAGQRALQGRIMDFFKHTPAYPDATQQGRAQSLHQAQLELSQAAARTRQDIMTRAGAARDARERQADAERLARLAALPPAAPATAFPSAPFVVPPAADVPLSGVTMMAAAACLGDAEVARSYGYGQYSRLRVDEAGEVERAAARLEALATPSAACTAPLLRRLAAELRAGRLLSLEEIMVAAQAQPSQGYLEIQPERERGPNRGAYNPCIESGRTCLQR